MLPSVGKLITDSEDLNRIQDKIRLINSTLTNPILGGVLVPGIVLNGGGVANDISHKLGRAPTGFLITRVYKVTPAPYAFYKTATAQAFANSASPVVNYDTKEVDAAGLVTTGAGWQFKCPIAGTYRVNAMATLSVGGAAPANLAQLKQLNIRKNATVVRVLARDRKDYYEIDSIQGTALIDCAAGDLLDVTLMQVNPGASTFSLYGDANYNHIELARENNTDDLWDTQSDLNATQQTAQLRLRSTLSKTVDLYVF